MKIKIKSLRTKLMLGFGIIVAAIIIMSALTYTGFDLLSKNTTKMNDNTELLIIDEKLAFNMAQRIALTRGYVLFGEQEYLDKFDQYTKESVALETKLLEITDSEKTKELIERSAAWEKAVRSKVFEPYSNGQEEIAKATLKRDIEQEARDIMAGFNELSSNRSKIVQDTGKSNIETGNLVKVVNLLIAAVVVILSILITFITARIITRPIKMVMERMNLIAQGDLSNDPLRTKSVDEVGQLVTATNQMSDNMRELLGEIHNVSESVSGQSEELTQSANEVKEGSNQVASTMQELSSGAETQANTTSDLASSMASFSGKVQQANQGGESVHAASQQVLELTEEGSQLMASSIEQMSKIDRIVQDAVEKVKGLDQQSQEISKLVGVIKDIADQTNLLALNAAIEAARAGEHGKGFAVVADEVRKLAEQVSLSVTDITGIVNSIQTESSVVTDSLQGGYKEVENGANQISTTGQTFENINSAVVEMVNNILEVSENLANIAENSETMNKSIEDIAAISEESAAGIEQTSASVQQTTSSMEEIAANSDQLARLAEDLNHLLRRFKL
ncbi:methyl-accepting chemotaxis protein [Radiobacillus kanasensis]|uniref:methyl-accepting chemotaxis protein n=1 Tax=Radiobacillus kanasensis TaxID=2844358 RepID=UPI001E560A92|nr:methyl-accepting chemotaxis protein [Radiobacillus kanasensis]UFT98276.1 methyl-accepting chemotaxis protein [Radiobacillus kanasensis]